MTRFALSLLVLVALATQQAAAQDFSNVKSGLLLGIYATPGNGGMRVSSTIPGYSAEGRLQPGDVLMRATVDGFTIYQLRSHFEMENTKTAIGPNREAAVEVWRPGVGMLYAWVEFTPIAGPAATAVRSYGAQFKMETEKGGARAMFQKQRPGQVVPFPNTQNNGNSGNNNSSNGNRDASSLFGR
ncbi:MAG: hypothetical protein KDA58_12700 [Planctomycetaceae bacterium]|nr:hypothetical protein [Planctomycetaceae bacterium]